MWPNLTIQLLDNVEIVETVYVNRTKPYKTDNSSPATLASAKVSKTIVDPNLEVSDDDVSIEDVWN